MEDEELISELPLVISEIRGQKKNRNRFSLYHQKRYLIGVSSKTLTDFSIQKGVILTPSLYHQLINSEHTFAAREKAFEYLGRSDHASSELKLKLRKKGFPSETVDSVIEELSGRNLLSDHSFAVQFAGDKAKLNQWGPKKIEAALLKKGVSEKIIQETLNNTFDNLSKTHICVDLIHKRKKHFLREEDLYRRQGKIFQYLAGRGFSGPDIKTAIAQSRIIEDDQESNH